MHVNNHLINLTTKIFISTGVFSVFYGYLQINQLDPIKWTKDSDRIVGTFANPNFYSSFIALTMIYVLSLSFSNKINYRLRVFSICYILAGFFLLVRVTSFQGFIVFLIGGSAVFLSLIRNLNKLRKRMLPIYVFFAVVLLSIILDILQKAPWISYLYKPSVSVRGDFWRASARIIEQYPLFGIGMDNFRSFYPVYRDMASLTHGEPTVADAAHNYFFDIGVGAGIPGLLAYILIVILTLFSANRILTRNQEFDYKIVGVIGCWVGFQAQSVISIGHLGLGIWGWVFSGIIIGSEICTRPPKLDSESKFINSNSVSYRSKYRVKEALLISSAGTLFGLGLSIPLLIGAINYQNAMREGDAIKLSSAATTWPQDTLLMSRTASFLITHGYPEIGISLAKNAAKLDPNFSVPWKILANSGQITEQEKNSIKKKIEKLDPLYQISEEYKLMSN